MMADCETDFRMKTVIVIPKWFQGPVGWTRCIFLLVALGGLTALAVAGIEDRVIAWQRANFRAVPCYIEESRVTKEKGKDERNLPGKVYIPYVRYQYEVDGETYSGALTGSAAKPLLNSIQADEFQQKYGPGGNAECYVHPSNPHKSMLQLPTNDVAILVAKFGAVALFLPLIGLIAIEVGLRADTRLKKPREARAPGWGEIDSGPHDQLKRTRHMLRERLES